MDERIVEEINVLRHILDERLEESNKLKKMELIFAYGSQRDASYNGYEIWHFNNLYYVIKGFSVTEFPSVGAARSYTSPSLSEKYKDWEVVARANTVELK